MHIDAEIEREREREWGRGEEGEEGEGGLIDICARGRIDMCEACRCVT